LKDHRLVEKRKGTYLAFSQLSHRLPDIESEGKSYEGTIGSGRRRETHQETRIMKLQEDSGTGYWKRRITSAVSTEAGNQNRRAPIEKGEGNLLKNKRLEKESASAKGNRREKANPGTLRRGIARAVARRNAGSKYK